MGGIGTGSIGRTFRGDFARYQLVPGIYEHRTVEANFFTVNIRKNDHTVYQQALITRRSNLKGFQSWNMDFNGEHATYYALYPQSWTVYNLPGQNVQLTCHQLSPIIPHNYKDSSLPVSLLNWTVENRNTEDIEVSLMFTWQSGSASDKFSLSDVKSEPFENYNNNGTSISGVLINQKLKNMPLQYCIAAETSDKCCVTYNCQFYPDDEQSGLSLWNDLINDGQLNNINYESSKCRNSKLTIAVCAKIKVKANSQEEIKFSLVWHMPEIYFSGDSSMIVKRFYTKYFDISLPTTSREISSYALKSQSFWLDQITDFQKPILLNKYMHKNF
jgi:non-lysosomal glucosylceramidase